MSPSPLKLRHLPKYGELGRLLLAHRNAADSEDDAAAADAEKLVDALQSMGPTYVKLGQLLSSRVDLLPPAYTEALGRLQDDVEPMAPGEGRRLIEEELGIRVSSAFATFEDEPMGAASLGQVHRATLRDGRRVAVKVQRPGIRSQILDDMDVISELAEMVDAGSALAEAMGLSAAVAEFRRSLLDELDYRQEAANLVLIGDLLSDYEHIVVPRPIDDFTTSRVLTMSYVEGRNIASIGPLGLLEIEGAPLADELFKAYLDQVLVHGVFHADPHPGNVLLTDDAKLALVDLGMVARVAPALQDALLRLLVALSEGKGAEASSALERLGSALEGYDPETLARRVSELVVRSHGASLAELEIGREMAELARIGAECGLQPPPELTLLAKALLNLDDVARRLDDRYQPGPAIKDKVTSIMRHRMLAAVSPTGLVNAALDAKEFTEQLPARMNKVLDALAEGKFTLNVEGVDEAELMRGVQKLANRGASGVVIAALVLSAAVFSISQHGPRLLGVSAFTVVLLALGFLVAAWTIFGTIRSDLPQRRRRP
ncbi:MAG: ABC1 kinase family protein [Acidimicrobiales bacterium]